MVELNLGCGDSSIEGCINVDLHPGKYVNETVDLNVLPWKWKDNSIDGIYISHCLEHLNDTVNILKECHRILKPGGFLDIKVPHASCLTAQGNLDHTGRLFTTASFDFLTTDNYLFGQKLFEQEYLKIKWFRKGFSNIWLIEWFIQFFIDLSPKAFERIWCYWVGGADEIAWKGIRK